MFSKRFYKFLKKCTSKRPQLLHFIRIIRAVLYLWPWRHLVVKILQNNLKNSQAQVTNVNCFSDLDADHIVRNIDEYGYSTGILLSEHYVDAVVRFYQDLDMEIMRNPHNRNKTIFDIAYNYQIIKVARKYFRVEPIFHSSVIYWSFPRFDNCGNPSPSYHQRFHYDVGDFRSLNVFIYLTNTNIDCGPHVVIETTHKYKKPSQLIRHTLTDKEAHDTYGDRVKVILGEKGTGFFENTTCFHKQLINKKPRLILNLVYSM